MPRQVIVGAGAVGTATAEPLAERGEQVRVVSRLVGGLGTADPAVSGSILAP